ncbi:MAG: Biopolymer transport protein ExbD/TolR [Bacteroidetes bacterium]|jgi:biopolymer transport protein ExbD|nr:Biopolymer transport protein ExbD/TolR [Bacteroidota bacterium]MDP2885765.1 biopolymer transporter ExbD [Ignavibacteria bacterium]
MGAVDLGGGRQHGKKGTRKKRRRLGIRIDMTPLVDVAFLLLTFFMLTTTFSLPQVMDITLPPSETKSEVTEASLLLVRLMEDGRIFWNMGTDAPRALDANTLRAFLQERINTNPAMITLVKVDRKSKYSNMVRIIDELHLANITRYSLAPLLEQDKKIVEQAAGKS